MIVDDIDDEAGSLEDYAGDDFEADDDINSVS